jgi:hypothetical protein
MTTQKQFEAAVAAVEDVLAHHKAIFTNGKALAGRAETARLGFMNRIMATSGDGHPLDIAKGHPEVNTILSLDSARDYLNTKAIAEAVTSSPEFIEAAGILDPLVAEVRRLEAQVAAEAQAAGIRAAERRDAIAAATSAALAAVEAEFAEPSPPAPAEAPPLIRGRQKLENAVA